jgi:hypothetical protein
MCKKGTRLLFLMREFIGLVAWLLEIVEDYPFGKGPKGELQFLRYGIFL